MKILCVFGQHNYGNPNRGEGYEYTNFIPTLRRLGHEVLFLDSWNSTCYSDFRGLNEALLRTVEQNRPGQECIIREVAEHTVQISGKNTPIKYDTSK